MNFAKSIDIFLKVAEAKSLNKAARMHNTTASHLSKQLAALEKKLGCLLFKRTKQGLLLTSEGQTFYESSKNVIHDLHQLGSLFTGKSGEVIGYLTIGAPRWLYDRFFMYAIACFLKKYPKTHIDLNIANHFGPLKQEGCDIIFAHESYGKDYAYLIRKKIWTSHRKLYASPKFLAQHPPIKKPEDCLQYNCLIRQQTGDLWELNGEYIKVSGNFQSNDGEALLKLACEGNGLFYSVTFLLEEELKEGKLVEVLPGYQSKPVNFYAYYQKENIPNPLVKLFLSFLEKFN